MCIFFAPNSHKQINQVWKVLFLLLVHQQSGSDNPIPHAKVAHSITTHYYENWLGVWDLIPRRHSIDLNNDRKFPQWTLPFGRLNAVPHKCTTMTTLTNINFPDFGHWFFPHFSISCFSSCSHTGWKGSSVPQHYNSNIIYLFFLHNKFWANVILAILAYETKQFISLSKQEYQHFSKEKPSMNSKIPNLSYIVSYYIFCIL